MFTSLRRLKLSGVIKKKVLLMVNNLFLFFTLNMTRLSLITDVLV